MDHYENREGRVRQWRVRQSLAAPGLGREFLLPLFLFLPGPGESNARVFFDCFAVLIAFGWAEVSDLSFGNNHIQGVAYSTRASSAAFRLRFEWSFAFGSMPSWTLRLPASE